MIIVWTLNHWSSQQVGGGSTSAMCAAIRAMLLRPTPLTPTSKALPADHGSW